LQNEANNSHPGEAGVGTKWDDETGLSAWGMPQMFKNFEPCLFISVFLVFTTAPGK
jgi:hypothetical protein